MKKGLLTILVFLLIIALMAGCTTQQKQSYATGQVYNPYAPPPVQGQQAPMPQAYNQPMQQYGALGCG